MRRHLLIIPLLALAAYGCSDPPGEERAPPGAVLARSLRQARELGPGKLANVMGTVNVASGSVDAGFAIQQGPRGLYVAADSGTRVARGQMVHVTGRVADQHGLLVLIPDSVRVFSRTEPFPAYQIRTRRVGEDTESLLVAVHGRITAPVVDDRPYGWKIMIDDGSGPLQIFVPAHHAFDPAAYQPGQTIGVEGMSAQYDSTYEVIATGPLRREPETAAGPNPEAELLHGNRWISHGATEEAENFSAFPPFPPFHHRNRFRKPPRDLLNSFLAAT